MKELLKGLSGITETKVAVLDSLIKLAKGNGGSVGFGDLEYIKRELIKQAGKGEINDALDLMVAKSKQDGGKK